MEKLKEFLKTTNKKTFLDIGTGSGNFIYLIKSIYDQFDSIVGIDTFERAIEAAKKGFEEDKRISFQVMDAYNMKYPDNSFDVVVLSNSLHHLKDITLMLKEMKRVLKNDGYILINEMLANNLDSMQESHKMLHHFTAEIDRLNGEIHNETFTKEEIIEYLTTDTNLKVVESWDMNVARRNENTKEEFEYIFNILERITSRFPENKRDELNLKKENIKKYIKQNGYDGCTSLITILKK